jgi:hypothetical protein
MAVPLPPNPFNPGPMATAYDRAILLEATHNMEGRLLGYMLIHAPNLEGQSTTALEINECANHEKLLELAIFDMKLFVGVCESSPPKCCTFVLTILKFAHHAATPLD